MPDKAGDLSSCDREPIHIPGSIQPHGCLLACDPSATTVIRYSENAAVMLGLDGEILGRDLADLIGAQPVHDLRNAMTATAGGRAALLLDFAIGSGGRYDVAAHRCDGATIIEFEPAQGGKGPLHRAREMIGRIGDTTSVDILLSRSARLSQALLGYDRVMIYRFDEDGAGQVVKEVLRPDLEPFLGQYFPASDIPAQARALYLRNTIRVISDARSPRVPIVPRHDAAGAPLDLSLAHLRSVSPIHGEYLRNIGVAASMSISIVVDGRLWGLIACHHTSPRVLPMAERVAAELFGQFLSLHLQALLQRERLAVATDARRALDRLVARAATEGDIERLLTATLPEFAQALPSDGVGLWLGGRWHPDGITPPPEAVPALVDRVAATAPGAIWSTHALGVVHPPAADWAGTASGLLAIPLSPPGDWLLFFRRAFVHTIDWAGDPNKTSATGPLGDRLTPRTSFAIWQETVADQSRPWTDADRETAEAIRAAVVEVVLRHAALMAEERGRADAGQPLLNEELNHRVMSIFAVIQSLIGHPIEDGLSLDDYVAALRGRIQALAFAHDQAARGDGGGLLADLLRAELGPFRDHDSAVELDGPGLWLDAQALPVMALILHELATNAAKHGALSQAGGRLAVAWRLGEDGGAEIEWIETGGPPTRPPERSGFGTALIERSIPLDLGGTARVTFRPEGLAAHLTLPARHVSRAEAIAPAAPWTAPPEPAPVTLPGSPSVLLVEDQMLIALDTESMLIEAGARHVATATTPEDALRRLRETPPDVAVLDVNLGRTNSLPIAEELTRAGIPFLFATGYGDATAIPEGFRSVPVVHKPYSAAALTAAIASVLPPVG